MNRETTYEIIVYARNTDNNKMHKALLVSLRPLYVTVKRYIEECSGSAGVS